MVHDDGQVAVDGWMGGWVDGWMGGWVDGWMGGGGGGGGLCGGDVHPNSLWRNHS